MPYDHSRPSIEQSRFFPTFSNRLSTGQSPPCERCLTMTCQKRWFKWQQFYGIRVIPYLQLFLTNGHFCSQTARSRIVKRAKYMYTVGTYNIMYITIGVYVRIPQTFIHVSKRMYLSSKTPTTQQRIDSACVRENPFDSKRSTNPKVSNGCWRDEVGPVAKPAAAGGCVVPPAVAKRFVVVIHGARREAVMVNQRSITSRRESNFHSFGDPFLFRRWNDDRTRGTILPI
jgi:hypothetical protein